MQTINKKNGKWIVPVTELKLSFFSRPPDYSGVLCYAGRSQLFRCCCFSVFFSRVFISMEYYCLSCSFVCCVRVCNPERMHGWWVCVMHSNEIYIHLKIETFRLWKLHLFRMNPIWIHSTHILPSIHSSFTIQQNPECSYHPPFLSPVPYSPHHRWSHQIA